MDSEEGKCGNGAEDARRKNARHEIAGDENAVPEMLDVKMQDIW